MTWTSRIGRPAGPPRARSSAVSKGWKLRSVRRAVCGVWGPEGVAQAPADPQLCRRSPEVRTDGGRGGSPHPSQNHPHL